jgi:hypothetical protein
MKNVESNLFNIKSAYNKKNTLTTKIDTAEEHWRSEGKRGRLGKTWIGSFIIVISCKLSWGKKNLFRFGSVLSGWFGLKFEIKKSVRPRWANLRHLTQGTLQCTVRAVRFVLSCVLHQSKKKTRESNGSWTHIMCDTQ